MLRKDTQLKLYNFIKFLSIEEKSLEVSRQILGEQPQFDPISAFRRIDKLDQNFISPQQIQEFLNNNGFKHSLEECASIILHYSNTGYLIYQNFKRLILPQQNEGLKNVIELRKETPLQNNLLPYDVELALSKIFLKEIQFFYNLQNEKYTLFKQIDFSVKDSFSTLDIYETGFLDSNNIAQFCQSVNKNLFEDQIISIIQCVDLDQDKKISLNDWGWLLQPRKEFNIKQEKNQEDPLEVYRKVLPSTQAFYINNRNQLKQEEIEKQFLPINNRATISIQKHINNNNLRRLNNKSLNQQQLLKTQGPFQAQQQQDEKKIQEQILAEMNQLARTLKQFIILDKQSENVKQNSVTQLDLDLQDCFRLFDVDGKGKCSPGEIEYALKGIGIYPSKYEIFLLIKRYDEDYDGKLNLKEFKNLICPSKKEYQNLIYDNKYSQKDIFAQKNGKYDELCSQQTKSQIIQIFSTLIENEAASESLRQRLNKRKNFHLKTIFSFLDQDKDGYLDLEDLENLFENNGMQIKQKDIIYLISRFDLNGDGLISYSEFLAEMNPKSPQKF